MQTPHSHPGSSQLIGIAYSPWTEKARWALDHHRHPYRYREHLILFGMPELRMRTGKWRGPLTVPTLIEERDGGGREVLGDSWDIARHADRSGDGAVLFPDAELARIEKYNALSERALDAIRIVFSARLLADPEAKAEALPAFVPGPLRRPLAGMATVGVAYIAREFGYSFEDRQRAEREDDQRHRDPCAEGHEPPGPRRREALVVRLRERLREGLRGTGHGTSLPCPAVPSRRGRRDPGPRPGGPGRAPRRLPRGRRR